MIYYIKPRIINNTWGIKPLIHKKLLALILVVFLTSIVLMPTSKPFDEENPWYEKFFTWSYRQKIKIPYNTTLDDASFKPVDLTIKFENPCWAKNIYNHSIRVVYQNKGEFNELESQVYNLNYSSENIITSCNLIFLIPENTDGNEEYYIYYDYSEKEKVDYIDHVSVEESYYRYEPLVGIFFESWYYLVIQDDSIIYTVSQKGKALSDPISQQVMKIKNSTEIIKTNSGEQTISFNFIYWWFKNNEWNNILSSEKLVSKKIIYDGNLMVKFLIISQSNDNSIQSSVYYTYYFSPDKNTSIYTNVKHEVLKHPLPTGDEIDVSFFIFNCGEIKSSTIDELNFGEIPRYMHFYSQDERIVQYKLDQNPENIDWQMVIGRQDDYDLGSSPWVSVDYGETGKAYGIIFDSVEVIKSGDNERNGIELQIHQANNIKLPGIDVKSLYIYLMRNSFEKNEDFDNEIPKNYVVNFNAELFSTDEGGFKAVEKEANLYKSFINYQPETDNNFPDDDEKNIEEYKITVYPHLTTSSFFKIISSTLLLKNTYVKVELYKDGILRGDIRAGRISFTQDYLIDWANTSFFKKAVFPNQNPGVYLVKIYLENLFLKEREFIGYSIIDLKDNTTVHIPCKSECKVNLKVFDQYNKAIKDLEAEILIKNVTILKTTSDSNGYISFGLPYSTSEVYTLKLFYKGFLLTQEEIKFGIRNLIITYKKNFNFSLHNFTIYIKDNDDKKIDFDFDVSLTSQNMLNPTYITPDNTSNKVYIFKNLPSSDYNLILKYNSLEFGEKIRILKNEIKTIILYKINLKLEDLWGLKPGTDLDIVLKCKDFEKPINIYLSNISSEVLNIPLLYPGNYIIEIYYENLVFEQNFKIPNNNLSEKIIFPVTYNITTKFYDLQGNIFSNGFIVLNRDSKNKTIDINSEGKVFINIPPGVYNLETFENNRSICKRKIDILSDKNIDIVTNSFSLNLIIYFVFLIVLLISFSIFSLKKKSYLHFLKAIIIILALTSIVLPWWTINCAVEESHIQSSTNLYIYNAKMITFTKTQNISAGYFSTSDDKFNLAINISYIFISIGVFLLVLSLFLKYLYKKKILTLILTFLAVITFLLSISLFYFTMFEFSNSTVGSLNGEGILDINIIGENMFNQILCSWHLSSGFIVITLVLLLSIFCLILEKKK